MANEDNRKQPEDPVRSSTPTEPPGGEGAVSAAELAGWAGVHERTVRAACNRGEIAGAVRQGGNRGAPKWHIPLAAAREWLESRAGRPPRAGAPEPPDGFDVAALERAIDRARIVELERRVVETERDALALRVAELEAELARTRRQVALLAAAVADTAAPPPG